MNTFHDIRILVKQLKKPIRNLISEVVRMVKFVLVMPAANAVSERSFTAIRRLYTYLRTNIGPSGLSNLHIHNDRLEKLSMVDVANSFVFEGDLRKILFRRFDDVDVGEESIPVKSVGIQVNINN